MAEHVAGSSIDESKYEQNQKRYWQQLHQELNRHKTELGATNSELAQCLGISRQPLVSFMQDASHGLPIRRANLERLWDLLTNPDRFKDKHLSKQARLKREDLRREGPDVLLKAAGFLPNAAEPVLTGNPERYQQIQRVVSKLSNFPISGFMKVVESVETSITNYFPTKSQISSDRYLVDHPSTNSGRLAEDWLKRWIEKNGIQPNVEVEKRFKGSIDKLSISGRHELDDSELFELYISISENERISNNINEFLKIRITQCQFKTLTIFLEDYILSHTKNIESDLKKAGLEAEAQLRFASPDAYRLKDESYLEDALSEFVMEVTITCNFRKTNKNVYWRYSSSTTHFENMLAAISYGMGYESRLELVDFSIQSLGRKDYSLVKTSTTFKDIDNSINNLDNRSYQGVWIDRSALIGVLQSVVVAVRGWLSEKFLSPESCKEYYEICTGIANIDNSLAKGRKVLNGYGIQCSEHSKNRSANHYLIREVIDKIKEIKVYLLSVNPGLWNLYKDQLEQKYCMASLSCVHSALVEGDMVLASKLMDDTEISLKEVGHKYIPLNVLFDSEKKLLEFFSGNQDILTGNKKWRSELKLSLESLSSYIYNSELRKHCGSFDSDSYMVAAEVFGRIGRLDFSCCGSEEIDELEEAVYNFLKAAYCSAKIGHKQRAAHWLSNASRVCCRLGQGGRAKAFSDLAASVIDRAIEPTYGFEYQEAVLAEVNIARGEILLLENNFPEAMKYFLRSLKGSIYIGFARLIADSLYDISIASKNLDKYSVGKSFEDAFCKDYLSNDLGWWKLKEDNQGWQANKIAAETIKFFNQLDEKVDWISISRLFQQKAKKVWRRLANLGDADGRTKHPIEDAIDSYQYLSRVGLDAHPRR